jgi:hypothetical protein
MGSSDHLLVEVPGVMIPGRSSLPRERAPVTRGNRVTRLFRLLALVLAPCLLAAACGGGDDGDGGGAGEAGPNTTAAEEEEGAGEPVAGGELTVAFDAETNGGYCLPEAQLAGPAPRWCGRSTTPSAP